MPPLLRLIREEINKKVNITSFEDPSTRIISHVELLESDLLLLGFYYKLRKIESYIYKSFTFFLNQ